jgi:hypothetical protein
MKTIHAKIQELFTISRKPANGWDEMETKFKAQDALIEELKLMARDKKTLVGRTLKFPMADSYALYVVTAVVTGTKVHVQWLDYCDAWKDGRLGNAGNVDLKYARSVIEFEDYIDSVNRKRSESEPTVSKPIDLSKSMF